MGVINYLLIGMILQAGQGYEQNSASPKRTMGLEYVYLHVFP